MNREKKIWFFLAFDFWRFCVVIRFFHPRHNGQLPPTLKDFYTRSYPLHYFLILFLEKEPVFPFSMLSAKQGNYWDHFYNVFGITRSLTGDRTLDLPHSKPGIGNRDENRVRVHKVFGFLKRCTVKILSSYY